MRTRTATPMASTTRPAATPPAIAATEDPPPLLPGGAAAAGAVEAEAELGTGVRVGWLALA